MPGPSPLQPGGVDIFYQYWLSQLYVYVTDSQSELYGVWALPTDKVSPIDGLVLALYADSNGQSLVLRVLLQDAKNCFTTADMRDVSNLLLVSFDKIVVLAVVDLEQVGFAQIPESSVLATDRLVDASYQRNNGYDDQLFIVRGTNATGQLTTSEIINYRDVTLTFGHFTYLQGESDTMFINDNSTHLFWTQVVVNPDWGVKQGVLYDYSLQSPHSFRHGAVYFSPLPSARWGAHAFSSASQVNAMMITYTDSLPGQLGFTIQAVYLDESLPSLRFVDLLVVNSSVLPSLGQSVDLKSLNNPDRFAAVMATQTPTGQLCLELFLHCPHGTEQECWV